jgi:23S rRNA G2069 N7-methylase RlmK/C1962 C5-methylase RlmI
LVYSPYRIRFRTREKWLQHLQRIGHKFVKEASNLKLGRRPRKRQEARTDHRLAPSRKRRIIISEKCLQVSVQTVHEQPTTSFPWLRHNTVKLQWL